MSGNISSKAQQQMTITAAQVQKFLRQFEPLSSVTVAPISEVISPWMVRLHGLVPIHGEVHMFESDLNLLEFKSPQDLVKLAEQLLNSFSAAATRARGQA